MYVCTLLGIIVYNNILTSLCCIALLFNIQNKISTSSFQEELDDGTGSLTFAEASNAVDVNAIFDMENGELMMMLMK